MGDWPQFYHENKLHKIKIEMHPCNLSMFIMTIQVCGDMFTQGRSKGTFVLSQANRGLSISGHNQEVHPSACHRILPGSRETPLSHLLTHIPPFSRHRHLLPPRRHPLPPIRDVVVVERGGQADARTLQQVQRDEREYGAQVQPEDGGYDPPEEVQVRIRDLVYWPQRPNARGLGEPGEEDAPGDDRVVDGDEVAEPPDDYLLGEGVAGYGHRKERPAAGAVVGGGRDAPAGSVLAHGAIEATAAVVRRRRRPVFGEVGGPAEAGGEAGGGGRGEGAEAAAATAAEEKDGGGGCRRAGCHRQDGEEENRWGGCGSHHP